jgi:formiminotetrahydrofolate cyclodeaminase
MPDIRIENEPLSLFLTKLASEAPVPGGGSVAALCGALGAALVSMVCNLTVNKKKYESYREEVNRILLLAGGQKDHLTGLINKDMEVFSRFSDAYKIPGEDPKRQSAIQAAAKEATDVPLKVAEIAFDVLRLCEPLVKKGNKTVLSDVGVAVVMADAAVKSALLNVYVNTRIITDKDFNFEKTNKIDALSKKCSELSANIYEAVKNNL